MEKNMAENIVINKIPSPTWSWLKMNKSSVELGSDFLNALPSSEKIPEGAEKTNVSKFFEYPLCTKLTSAAGKEFASFADSLEGIEPAFYELSGKIAEPIVFNFNVPGGERLLNKTFFHVNDDCECTVIFLFSADEAASGFFVSTTSFILEKNAKLHVVKAQILGKEHSYIDDTRFACGENASAEFSQVELGAGLAYSAVSSELLEYKSNFKLNLGYYCENTNLLDINHVVNQYGKKTDCVMRVKGTLSGQAKKTYRGTIDFKCGCAGSTGDEQEETLLLSPEVVNNSIPVILCDEEDVSGEHGASIGRVSDEVLFYMKSRGVSKKEAENLLARAKVQSVASLICDQDVLESVEKRMDEVFGR